MEAPKPLDVATQAGALLRRPPLWQPTTVDLTPGHPVVRLEPGRDYVVRIARASVFTAPVTISGGHNVVLENATLDYRTPLGAAPGWLVRGLYLTNQTGVMWVSNLSIRGPLTEGIDLSERMPGAAVVLRNIDVGAITGSYTSNHADLLQTWAGPDRLVVDGFKGTSDYQGFMLKPKDLWPTGPLPTFFSLRDVHLDMSHGVYALWRKGAFPLRIQSVSVRVNPDHPSRDRWLWPKPSTGDLSWSAVRSE